jgi:FMN-dependent NADH-azoreductase
MGRDVEVLASGGIFTEGRGSREIPWSRILRQILGVIGIDDVQTVRAQGMNIPGLSDHATPDGERAIDSLVI